ncbi:alpha/beta fold hydrolase [bacterium]|nr:MAG: alpha/beta fold hydrolase [bacterium]
MTLHSLRRAATNPTLRLVLLHGYGSDERDMYGLARELPPEIDVVCLRAPGETENGGYAWFDISIDESGFGFDEEGFQMAVALVLQELPSLRTEEVPFVVGGFSQGAMVAAAVTLIEPRVDAAWLMSGAFPPGLEMPASGSRPVFVQHGTMDPVLPVAMGRDLAKRLGEAGLQVESREYPMAHSISATSLEDGIEWLNGLVG